MIYIAGNLSFDFYNGYRDFLISFLKIYNISSFYSRFTIIYYRKKKEMQTTHGIYTSTHLTAPHYSSPGVTYTKLMQSSTRILPERQTYMTQRITNNIEGSAMRK